MNKTEEIVKEFDRKRLIVHRLRYAEQMALLLTFYSYYRFATDNLLLLNVCFACAFLTVLVKQGYLLSLYGIGTTRHGKDLPVFKWKILVLGVFIGLLLVEVVSFLMMNIGFV